MTSFANGSDTKLANRPKMPVFVQFYRNQEVRGKILHSTQLDHSTKKHCKFYQNLTTPSCESRVYKRRRERYRRTERQRHRQTDIKLTIRSMCSNTAVSTHIQCESKNCISPLRFPESFFPTAENF